MTDLGALSIRLGVSDRTLRRAADRGTIRCIRHSERCRELPVSEELYLEKRWETIHRLVSELRTLPNVRLAVLFGSLARGDERAGSDLDVLVRFDQQGLSARSQLTGRLERAAGRAVQIVEVDAAPALLLSDVLRDGRVLVDRDEDWQQLNLKGLEIEKEAAAGRQALTDDLTAGLSELFAEIGS